MSRCLDIVIPTSGRPSLHALLTALASPAIREDVAVIVVDDRAQKDRSLDLPDWATYVRGDGAGPAAARNRGWRSGGAPWVVFLDDDVLPTSDWFERLLEDVDSCSDSVGGIQGRIHVPLPADRRPTDYERGVAGLESARWATADMAYRRTVLETVGGFDERFPRAYREDADLALRVLDAGFELRQGTRTVDHPVPSASMWASVLKQAGNRDDVLMTAKHGPHWYEQAGAPRGRRPLHMLTVVAAGTFVAGLVTGRRSLRSVGLASWTALTGQFAALRARAGPPIASEVGTVLLTSIVIPFAATWHWLRAAVESRTEPSRCAVLLDRDGTLVDDVPYNHDPKLVVPMPTARRALDRLRAAGIPTAIVSNQSGVARGRVSLEEVTAVNRRIEELLGPLGDWFVCTHGPDDGCGCRKPAPGLILEAADRLGVRASDCFLIGDIGADVEAARAAGARPILVPTKETRPEEIAAAPVVAPTLDAAVDFVLEASRA